jgi:uncharacterized membrane protein YjgN (DUF898 family)
MTIVAALLVIYYTKVKMKALLGTVASLSILMILPYVIIAGGGI